MSIHRATQRLAVLSAAVLVGGPVATATAAPGSMAHAVTVSHVGATQPAGIKCDETPPGCDPEICFCPVW
jgi:hypothetical protein